MKRPGWMILAIALFAALPAAAENFTQCLTNCPPGVNACSNCCFAQFDAAKGPCFNDCQAAQRSCFDAAWRSCQGDSNPQWCYQRTMQPCQNAVFACERTCDNTVQVAGGCPGEVPPQKCPWDCQLWNSASQSCIGPQMNGCPPMAANAAPQAESVKVDDDAASVWAARAKQAADAAAAHAKKLQGENAAKAKAKKKSK